MSGDGNHNDDSHNNDDLKVPLGNLRRQLRTPRHVELSATIDSRRVSDTEIDPTVPVEVSVTLEAVPDGVTVTGSLDARWRGECNLCLEQVGGELHADVQEVFEDAPSDEDVYRLHHEYVDLTPMVSDALLLELPLLAKCPFGGVGECERAPDLADPDESEEQPEEAEPKGDPRWAALDELTFDDD